MQLNRSIHRIVTLFVVAFTLYLGVTGTIVQLIDFRSIITQPSPFDANLMAMREDFEGPMDFKVLRAGDYISPSLPQAADIPAMFAATLKTAARELDGKPLRYVELRMADGRPVGHVQSGTAPYPVYRFDAASGESLGETKPLQESESPISARNTFKHLHRMTVFGTTALWINVIVSAALVTLIVTGTIMYVRLLQARRKVRRKSLFWKGGDWWKMLHRWISIAAAVFLAVITLSGSWLAVESLVFGYYIDSHPFTPANMAAELAAVPPLPAANAPAMLQTILASYHTLRPHDLPRVVRLRVYGTMKQGAVISGEATAHQYVFDATTGRQVSLTEPGYRNTGFPFGWQAHQTAKAIHRGSYFGLTGRVVDLLSGFAMIYLSVSGGVMYWQMWSKRRRLGRKQVIWV